jgi:hypothetical protein
MKGLPTDKENLARQTALIEEIVRKAVRKALWIHHRLGNPICVWRDGKVVWVPPEKIPEEFGETPSTFMP